MWRRKSFTILLAVTPRIIPSADMAAKQPVPVGGKPYERKLAASRRWLGTTWLGRDKFFLAMQRRVHNPSIGLAFE